MRKFKIRTGIASIVLVAGIIFAGCSTNTQPDYVDTPATVIADETSVSEALETAEAPESSAAEESIQSAEDVSPQHAGTETQFSYGSIPAYSGSPYVAVNDNIPFFTDEELTTQSFETYSELDSLGRCGVAYACIGQDLMPTEDRESISEVTPSGWNNKEYDFVDGGWLYNRCHLIGFQLTGENANEKNLITGTRSMNVDGMLLFENMTADYIKETGNHVMYRVTPVFEGDELVPRGVLMEGKSVEDNGEGILFNVFVYNVQSGVEIDYMTGDSKLTEAGGSESSEQDSAEGEYILNTNTKKFHLPDCSSVTDMDEDNREGFSGSREELIDMGYEPCGHCNP